MANICTSKYTLEKTEGAIKNGRSRNASNILISGEDFINLQLVSYPFVFFCMIIKNKQSTKTQHNNN